MEVGLWEVDDRDMCISPCDQKKEKQRRKYILKGVHKEKAKKQ